MQRLLVLILVAATSSSVWAAIDCARLVTVEELPLAFTNSELSGARAWRQGLIGGQNPKGFGAFLRDRGVNEFQLSEAQREDWLDRYVLQQWSLWRAGSDEARARQRNEALALELKKISPPSEPGGVFSLDGKAQLNLLSLRNKEHLLMRLEEIQPVIANAEVEKIGREMADKLVFNYMQSRSGAKVAGVAEPLASQRELGRIGLQEPLDFYSNLVQASPSVAFDVVPTNRSHGLYNLGALIGADKTRLTEDFARDNGFLIPRPRNALELMLLFSRWQPEAMDEVLKSLRWHLPASIDSIDKLFAYSTPAIIDSLYASDTIYASLAPLRTRLSQFVLNETDGEEFLREAFVRFVLWRADGKVANISDIRQQFEKNGGAQSLFISNFKDFLGWGEIALRIPAVVPAKSYQIVQTLATPPMPSKQRPGDSHRLDHNLMP